MFEVEKKEVLEVAKKIKYYGLIALSGGNVSARMPDGNILVTPSGMDYDDMVPEDVVVIDLDGNVVEGKTRPSVDSGALLHIYNNMPEVNAAIHTHQPYATAVGLMCDELPAFCTTLVNATKGAVTVAPYSPAADVEMGVMAVKYLNGKLAVILKHHGVISVGKSLKEALYACVYLEEAAKTYIAASSMTAQGKIPSLDTAQVERAVDSFNHYGQDVKA